MSDFVINNGVLEKYEGSDKNVDIPADVVEIGAEAFSGNDAIVSVNLPAGLKQIKYYAFGDCKNLEKISFPEGLETISSVHPNSILHPLLSGPAVFRESQLQKAPSAGLLL